MDVVLLVLLLPLVLLFGLSLGLVVRRAAAIRAFLGHRSFEAVGFGEVVWGRPILEGRDVDLGAVITSSLLLTPVVLLSLASSFFLDLSNEDAEKMWMQGSIVAMAVVGLLWRRWFWRHTRLPRVERLRFTQQTIQCDVYASGFNRVTDTHLLSHVASTTPPPREIAWEDVEAVRRVLEHVVIHTHDGAETVFGPLPEETADRIVEEARRRLAAVPNPEPERARQMLDQLRHHRTRDRT